MIPPEDSAAQTTPDLSWTSTQSDYVLLEQHNESMTQVLREFSKFVGEFRSDQKDEKSNTIKLERLEKEEVSRKRNFDKI